MGADSRDGEGHRSEEPGPTASRYASATKRLTKALARLWRHPDLPTTVTIEVSPRLSASLGRAIPARGIVRLHPGVAAGPPALLREVLTHELAHVVAWRMDGAKSGLHGPVWAALMEQAGYEPRTCLAWGPPREGAAPGRPEAGPRPPTREPRRYVHTCPVCHTRRTAGRPVRRWRCARCLEAGLPGTLTVRRVS